MALLPRHARRAEALGQLWYLAFLLLQPALGQNSREEWLVIAGSVAVFLPLYLRSWREPAARGLLIASVIAVLGLVVMPFNGGGGTYLIYAAVMCSWRLSPRAAVACHAGLVLATLGEMVLLDLPIWTWMVAVVGVVAVGGASIRAVEGQRQQARLLRAQEEVEEMAAVAERERIARDLHDVLGHTLSVIALKSELASRLAESDPQRAVAEIRDVERVSRQALSDVRSAVEGYRQRGLSGEVRAAEQALAAANITFEIEIPPLALSARQETALALTLREAVTNVVRHAGATRCAARLRADGQVVTLTIQDDGRGGSVAEGNGFAGMRSRIGQVGGHVEVDGHAGMRLTVTLPAGMGAVAS